MRPPNTMNILMVIQFSQQEFQNQMDYQKHRNFFNLPMRLRHQTSKGLTNFKMHTANARLYKNLFDLKLNMPDSQNKWISGLLNRHACLAHSGYWQPGGFSCAIPRLHTWTTGSKHQRPWTASVCWGFLPLILHHCSNYYSSTIVCNVIIRVKLLSVHVFHVPH